jgi:MarR family transcriptional regulator, organic hydroperoxide resistance regulator
VTRAHNTEEFPLGPALDFLQRLWRLNHALERLSGRMEKKFGVTAQQRLLIRCVGAYPGMTAGQLANVLNVDPGTVSAALRRLEQKKLIERRRDPVDSRRVALGLTQLGRALDTPAVGTVEAAVAELLATTPAGDVQVLTAALERLTALVDEKLTS